MGSPPVIWDGAVYVAFGSGSQVERDVGSEGNFCGAVRWIGPVRKSARHPLVSRWLITRQGASGFRSGTGMKERIAWGAAHCLVGSPPGAQGYGFIDPGGGKPVRGWANC